MNFTRRFKVDYVVENGEKCCKIYDSVTDRTIYCDTNEVNETIWELLGEYFK